MTLGSPDGNILKEPDLTSNRRARLAMTVCLCLFAATAAAQERSGLPNPSAAVILASWFGFTITLREGHGPGEVACIDLAQLKATRIDLGELEPGTYTVVDGGGGTARTAFEVS